MTGYIYQKTYLLNLDEKTALRRTSKILGLYRRFFCVFTNKYHRLGEYRRLVLLCQEKWGEREAYSKRADSLRESALLAR